MSDVNAKYEKWWKEYFCKVYLDYAAHDEYSMCLEAYAAGFAQAEREIMARFPDGEHIQHQSDMENVQSLRELSYRTTYLLAYVSCANWLRSRLFPNDKRGEVG